MNYEKDYIYKITCIYKYENNQENKQVIEVSNLSALFPTLDLKLDGLRPIEIRIEAGDMFAVISNHKEKFVNFLYSKLEKSLHPSMSSVLVDSKLLSMLYFKI